MSFSRGPNIVTDGLVFYIDADNPKSYPQSGLYWYDLMGNEDVYLSTISRLPEIYFDGIDDQEFGNWPPELVDDNNTVPRTWEVWCEPSASFTTAEIFGHRGNANTLYSANGGIYIYNGRYYFIWYDNSQYQFLDSGVTATANQYAHVVATFQADVDDQPRIYVNGELKATFPTATDMTYSAGTANYCLGYNERDGGKDFFGGRISIVRYYRAKALSLQEVQQNYNSHKSRFRL